MRIPSEQSMLIGAIKGWQARVTLSAVSQAALTQASLEGQDAQMVGTWTPGTYYGIAPCQGCGQVDLKLKTSAVSNAGGNVVVDIWRVLMDLTEKYNNAGVTQKATSGLFVNGTEQTLQQTGLLGELVCIIRLVVPASSSVTFDRAEYSAL